MSEPTKPTKSELRVVKAIFRADSAAIGSAAVWEDMTAETRGRYVRLAKAAIKVFEKIIREEA